MSNEAQVTSSLYAKVGNFTYNGTTTFRADVSTGKGATPGRIDVSVSGTDIDLNKLAAPGLAKITNLDAVNYVVLGIYEPDTDFFYPTDEYLPGESYVKRFPRFAGRESTGTGTLVGYNSRYQLRANTATCSVQVDVLEK